MVGKGGRKVDGIFFFWIAWIVIVFLIFFVPSTNSNRDKLLIQILLLVYLSNKSIPLYNTDVNAGALLLIIFASFYIGNLRSKNKWSVLVISFLMGLCTSSFILFSFIDPIWVLFDPKWMLTIILTYLSIILLSDWKQRLLSIVLGMLIGDGLLFLVFDPLGVPYEMATLTWYDQLSMVVTVSSLWHGLELLAGYMYTNKTLGKKEVKSR
jgi:hypothetical protein